MHRYVRDHLGDELSCNFRYILFLQACKEHLHSNAGQFSHVLRMVGVYKNNQMCWQS